MHLEDVPGMNTTCLDDYINFLQIYLLTRKSETAQYLKNDVSEVEIKGNLPVAKIRSYYGGEYQKPELFSNKNKNFAL